MTTLPSTLARLRSLGLLFAAIGLAAPPARSQTPAARANDFLDSLGVNTQVHQGDNYVNLTAMLLYTGIRQIREDQVAPVIYMHNNTTTAERPGVKACLVFPQNADVSMAGFMQRARDMKAAGVLLAIEGPNEPNNWKITYNGQTMTSTDYLPLGHYMKAIYEQVKADPALGPGVTVFHTTDAPGAQPNNCGLQFATIPTPAPAGVLMPAGTKFADALNCHNYVCKHAAPVDNNAWNAASPDIAVGPYNGVHANFGDTWAKGYDGHTPAQLAALPKVTTETGWFTTGANSVSEDVQGRLTMSIYLSQFKRGWKYTFIYEARDNAWGLMRNDYSYKLAADYLHNFTTILADTNATFSPGAVNYSIPSAPATVHDLLLQKGNGSYELVVWNEKANGSNNVTVNLGATYPSVKVYDPTVGTAPVQTLANVSSVPLTLGVFHPKIIEFSGSPASELVKDNADASGIAITGSWLPSTSTPGYYGANYLHDNNAGKGTKSVRFTPTIPTTGAYAVSARWTSGSNRASNVPIDIIHGSGTATVTVNQQTGGGDWVTLGIYNFNAGTAGSALVRTTNTNGHVLADAVRWVPSAPIIVDNGDSSGVTITGPWTASSSTAGYHGSNYLHDNGANKGSMSVRFTPAIPSAGNYEVFGRWTAFSNRASNVPFDITHSGGTSTTLVNQQANGAQWFSLGVFHFSAGSGGNVLVRNAGTTAGSIVIADAVQFTPSSGGGGGGGLPSPWAGQDIGAVGVPGNAAFSGGVFTVNGSGADTDNSSSDSFHFVHQAASGDCAITARVASQSNGYSTAKYGVMIRESLNANSANAFMMMYPAGLKFKYRAATAGSPTTIDGGSGATPYWVRVTRVGNTFTASKSTDGVAWTTVGSTTITMGASVYIGLVECSTNNSQLGTVTFDNVTATP